MKTKTPPLFHIIKRDDIPVSKALLIRLAAVLLALLVSGLLFMMMKHKPMEVYGSMLQGSLGGKIKIQETVKTSVPLLVASLAVTFAFRMRFWNIGAEGQILMGGIAAMGVALAFEKALPRPLLLILMAVAAFVGGGLFGAIPAFFKAKWDTNETLFTLMMNYIASQFVLYLSYHPAWQDPRTTFPKLRSFPVTSPARLPKLFGVHIGWVLALILVFLAWFYWNRTKQGYELTVLGDSKGTARYAGMDVFKITLRTMIISAGLAGFVGFLIFAGADGTMSQTSSGGVGFTAITVSWMSGFNAIAMILVSFFIAMLNRGASNIQTTHGIPKSAADVVTGLILFFVLGAEFFIRYRIVFQKGGKHDS